MNCLYSSKKGDFLDGLLDKMYFLVYLYSALLGISIDYTTREDSQMDSLAISLVVLFLLIVAGCGLNYRNTWRFTMPQQRFGEALLQELGFQAQLRTTKFGLCRYWVRRGEGDGPEIVLLHGFNHTAGSWARFVSQIWGVESGATIIVVDRNGVGGTRPRFPGFTTLAWQTRWVIALVRVMREDGVLSSGFTVIGHSVGGIMARRLPRHFPEMGRVIQIAPVSVRRYALGASLRFWAGAVWVLPFTLVPAGMIATAPTAAILFTGRQVSWSDFWDYVGSLAPDSTVAFLEALFTYSGESELREAHAAGWAGETVVFACEDDWTISPASADETAMVCGAGEAILLCGVPHCLQVLEDIGEDNVELLRTALGE